MTLRLIDFYYCIFYFRTPSVTCFVVPVIELCAVISGVRVAMKIAIILFLFYNGYYNYIMFNNYQCDQAIIDDYDYGNLW